MSVEANINVPVILVINTNLYTGNFERQLCAYVTGCTGECEVGDREAVMFLDEVGEDTHDEISDFLSYEADDHGCRRPVSIWNDDGFGHYESLAIFFRRMPDPRIIQLILDRAQAYAHHHNTTPRFGSLPKIPLEIKGCKLIEREVKITDTTKVLL